MRNILKFLFYNKSVHLRFIFLFAFFLILFNSIAIISYYLLPEGFLLSKNSILDWETSDTVIMSAVQIIMFNSLSAIIIAIANFFAFPNKRNSFMPLGYWCFIIQIILNGITLGTWSFTATNVATPDLSTMLLRTFDIFHRAGLWEMTGQLLIASATARIAIVEIAGRYTYARSLKETKLRSAEMIYIIIGACLMIIGAFIESNAIITKDKTDIFEGYLFYYANST